MWCADPDSPLLLLLLLVLTTARVCPAQEEEENYDVDSEGILQSDGKKTGME